VVRATTTAYIPKQTEQGASFSGTAYTTVVRAQKKETRSTSVRTLKPHKTGNGKRETGNAHVPLVRASRHIGRPTSVVVKGPD
jgi:hypothetical protein